MPAPNDLPLIAALDIGSSKVSALIVTPEADGRLRVLGTGQRESRGVRRGYVTDMEATEVAVREAVILVTLEGPLDIRTSPGFRESCAQAGTQSAVDLSAVTLIDSAGLPAGPPRACPRPRFRFRKDGPCRDRTYDLGIKSPLLCQLS